MSRSVSWIAFVLISLSAAAQSPPLPASSYWPAPLLAEVQGFKPDGTWEPPSTTTSHLFGTMSVRSTPGFWVYPIIWVRLLPATNEANVPVYQQLLAHFPFLATPPAPSFLEGPNVPAGYPDLLMPDGFLTPYLNLALGAPAGPNAAAAVKRTWQPICMAPDNSGAPTSYTGLPDINALAAQSRTWSCMPSVWAANSDPSSVPVTTWWNGNAAAADTPTLLDLDPLVQKVLTNQTWVIPPAPGESISSFFKNGPNASPAAELDSWYDHAKLLGLEMMVQFIGLVSTSPNHQITSNENTTGGLTGLNPAPPGTSLPPRISWSNMIGIRYYVPRPENDAQDPMMVHSGLPTAIQSGNIITLKVRAAVTPLAIRVRDSSGAVFNGWLEWSGPGNWSVQLPSWFAAGNGTILRLSSPYETLMGTGKPWATVYHVPQFP